MTDTARLSDILERIDRIARATQDGEVAFRNSEIIQDAVIRNLEVIGEATKSLSPRTRRQFPDVPWREMARFRDLAIHHYGKLVAEEIWRIVADDLPRIKRAVAHVSLPTVEEARRGSRRG